MTAPEPEPVPEPERIGFGSGFGFGFGRIAHPTEAAGLTRIPYPRVRRAHGAGLRAGASGNVQARTEP